MAENRTESGARSRWGIRIAVVYYRTDREGRGCTIWRSEIKNDEKNIKTENRLPPSNGHMLLLHGPCTDLPVMATTIAAGVAITA